ncbi:L-rhamnose/proton symporter RhaT [Flavihumibacter petaseus]|uniref:L-rhamnose/proton symporter n=1 Tax=Flavihumibacter petaseus NBRC 106054 TaxID=1220578 RepID=A0A0E9MWQ9_9BACT|nr:L-rhamnose/proton symporter RhaT [Flavihumibacter petaseus]GAO42019.1 L-rhamnose/proton symporter [Flavihumibacter petaseus NBRC 106054]
MHAILGVIFHFIGGFASGSFYIPYKKVKGWSWETYWLIGGLFSWLIVPPLAAWLTIPDFWQLICSTEGRILWLTYMFGLLWGIGGLTYGLGVRWLGVSLGSSIILGLCMVFGALIPSVYYEFFPAEGKDTISLLTGSTWGRVVLSGLLVCIVGIVLCGKAGMRKEKEVVPNGDQQAAAHPEAGDVSGISDYRFGAGLTVAIISGILSACFNFGLEAGKPLAMLANDAWKAAHPGEGEFLYRNNVVYVVLLWGGLTTNLVWCLYLNARNKTFGDYSDRRLPLAANLLFCALAGTTWFLQFFFYGMGESKLSNGPSSWILHMAFIILVANAWGLILKEWRGVKPATRQWLMLGIIVIILSVIVVGWGNSIRPE